VTSDEAVPPIEHSLVQSSRAVTPRSSLDLLRLSYPFSQVGLLDARDFAKEAEKRRSRTARHLPMNTQVPEELHRQGLLVPLFRVDLTPGEPEGVIDIAASLTAQQVTGTVTSQLYFAAAEGRAVDPAAEAFVSWPSERRRTLWPTYDSGYVYSRYQLLGLDVVTPFIAKLIPERKGKTGLEWHLSDADQGNEPTLEALRSWRALAIMLSALDTYYWPFITHTVRHDLATWRVARQDFDPASTLTWLEVSVDQLAAQANDLRIAAAFRDDTGDFYDVVRRASAEAWDSLRGDALSAMDFRLAADIVDRFREEMGGTGAPSGMHVPLDQEGLSSQTHSLDAALTDLHLSPFPSLVIGVEGETEARILPKVMEQLGINLDQNWIRVVEYGGTTKGKHLSLLARYAAAPVLGRDLGSGTVLDRPTTRILVLADAENEYATPADRRRQRKLLLDSIAHEIPADLKRDLYNNTRRGRTVEIMTWGKWPFEFAHFTDAQLADAVQSVAKTSHPNGRAGLIAAIHRERLTPSPNIDDVNWRGRGRLSKPDLADAMWPLLEKRIERAINRKQQGPPIMKAAFRAFEMASSTHRSNTMLRHR
jgi:hypothetical protein